MAERLTNVEVALRRAIETRVEEGEEVLRDHSREIHRAIADRAERLELELAGRAAAVEARSPLRALARGYAMVTAEDQILRDPRSAPAGTPLRITLADGILRARSEGPEQPEPNDDG